MPLDSELNEIDPIEAYRAWVGADGGLRLPEAQRRRWGLSPGAGLRVEETADGLLLRPADPPLRKVYVEPTTACNLNCPICVRHSWREPGGAMTMATYRRLVEGLRDIPTLQAVAFWGLGEPLLHPNILEMVAEAGRLGARTELISNGLLLDARMAEGLIQAGLDTLILSVDGDSTPRDGEVRAGVDRARLEQQVRELHALRRALRRENPEIGLEFVVTRRNLPELASLRRLAHTLEATFVVVSNVLPYTQEFEEEILYWLAAGNPRPQKRSRWSPEMVLPRMDARPEVLEPLLSLLRHGGTIDPLLGRPEKAYGYCRFVREGAVAVAWDGGVSPCIPLMHSYTCYVLGREKAIQRYTVGNVNDEEIADIYDRDEYRRFRARVVEFDFSPCADCGGCEYAESNEEDCFGNPFPTCGDCLWARGIIQCP
jgi:MoaA/NifB/PqqE/SkfB family radical SAM enzyme